MSQRARESNATRRPAVAIGEKLLTIKEVAAKLQVSTRTVRAFVKRGDLEGRIIAQQWRFRSADVDRFVEYAPREWEFAGKESDGD